MKILRRFEEIAYALLPETHPDISIRCRHFALLFKKNRIICIGWNKVKTHPINQRYNYHKLCGIHAECDVLIKSKTDDFRGYNMAILRIDKNNKINYSAPCKFCCDMLETLNLNKIFYTNEYGKWCDL